MAEPLSPEEFQIFLQHMEKFPDQKCPVCGTTSWGTIGLEAAPPFLASINAVQPAGTGGKVMPVVVIACKTCAYVRSFAWFAIVKLSGPGSNG
jgi:hypothetical protein